MNPNTQAHVANERIVGVAIFWKGQEYRLPKPHNHFDLIWSLYNLPGGRNSYGPQGFYSSYGRFLDRVHAAEVALRSGQIDAIPPHRENKLYSEDLW